jgi:hypothetical protein
MSAKAVFVATSTRSKLGTVTLASALCKKQPETQKQKSSVNL